MGRSGFLEGSRTPVLSFFAVETQGPCEPKLWATGLCLALCSGSHMFYLAQIHLEPLCLLTAVIVSLTLLCPYTYPHMRWVGGLPVHLWPLLEGTCAQASRTVLGGHMWALTAWETLPFPCVTLLELSHPKHAHMISQVINKGHDKYSSQCTEGICWFETVCKATFHLRRLRHLAPSLQIPSHQERPALLPLFFC